MTFCQDICDALSCWKVPSKSMVGSSSAAKAEVLHLFIFLLAVLNCLMCISVYGMQCASTFTLHCSSVASLVRFLVRPRKHLVSHGGIQIQEIPKGPTKDG